MKEIKSWERTGNKYLKRDINPMEPMYFLIIFGQKDYIQINYPEDFANEESIKEQILPRTPDEIELIISQSLIEIGWVRFRHTSRENINKMLNFNGRTARIGISLENFQRRLKEPRNIEPEPIGSYRLVAKYNKHCGLTLYREFSDEIKKLVKK